MMRRLKNLINKTEPAYEVDPLTEDFNPVSNSITGQLPLGPNNRERITVIDNDGYVFWDNVESYLNMDNHNTRKEVQGALNGRSAWAARVSESLSDTPYRNGFGRTVRYSLPIV